MMGGIDNQVKQAILAAGNNPQAMAQGIQKGGRQPSIVELLALQKMKSEKEATAREMQLQMAQQPQTILQQREQEVASLTQNEVMNQMKPTMQRRGQESIPPALRGQAPNAATQGIAQASQGGSVQRLAGGGIVSFQEGGETKSREEKRQEQLIDKALSMGESPEEIAKFIKSPYGLNYLRRKTGGDQVAIAPPQQVDVQSLPWQAAGVPNLRGTTQPLLPDAQPGQVPKAYSDVGRYGGTGGDLKAGLGRLKEILTAGPPGQNTKLIGNAQPRPEDFARSQAIQEAIANPLTAVPEGVRTGIAQAAPTDTPATTPPALLDPRSRNKPVGKPSRVMADLLGEQPPAAAIAEQAEKTGQTLPGEAEPAKPAEPTFADQVQSKILERIKIDPDARGKAEQEGLAALLAEEKALRGESRQGRKGLAAMIAEQNDPKRQMYHALAEAGNTKGLGSAGKAINRAVRAQDRGEVRDALTINALLQDEITGAGKYARDVYGAGQKGRADAETAITAATQSGGAMANAELLAEVRRETNKLTADTNALRAATMDQTKKLHEAGIISERIRENQLDLQERMDTLSMSPKGQRLLELKEGLIKDSPEGEDNKRQYSNALKEIAKLERELGITELRQQHQQLRALQEQLNTSMDVSVPTVGGGGSGASPGGGGRYLGPE